MLYFWRQLVAFKRVVLLRFGRVKRNSFLCMETFKNFESINFLKENYKFEVLNNKMKVRFTRLKSSRTAIIAFITNFVTRFDPLTDLWAISDLFMDIYFDFRVKNRRQRPNISLKLPKRWLEGSKLQFFKTQYKWPIRGLKRPESG